jgi:hypothetical protein
MMGQGSIRPAFAIATVLLVAIIAELFLSHPGAEVASLPPLEAVPSRTLSPFSPAHAVDVILSRPLFRPGRRREGGGMLAHVDDTLPRLTGIVITPSRKVAVFQPAAEKAKALMEGDSIGGWTIQKIDHQQVVLQKSGGTMTIVPTKEPSNGEIAGGISPRGNPVANQNRGPAPILPGMPMLPAKAVRP